MRQARQAGKKGKEKEQSKQQAASQPAIDTRQLNQASSLNTIFVDRHNTTFMGNMGNITSE